MTLNRHDYEMDMTREEQFEHLFRAHYTDLCRYAARYISDPQLVEDIVQGFFVAVWEKEASLSVDVQNFLPYARRAVYNRCLNYYKAQMSKEHFLTLYLEEWHHSQTDAHDCPYKEEIHAAVRRLPPQCRKVFLLKCIKGLKYKEIAEITGISIHTVKYHIGEAFRILHRELAGLLTTFPPILSLLSGLTVFSNSLFQL